MTLADLPAGQSARVRAVDGPRAFRRRLLELGLVPGVEVAFVRRAPLGDPLEFRLRGSSVSLRAADARHVTIVSAAP